MNFSKKRIDVIPLSGGMDSVTTPILVKSGKVISSSNFEPDIFGGYRRMPGIERHDGRTRPSDAVYAIFTYALSGAVSAGDTVTGVTSGATAVVLLVVSSTELVVTKVVGTFVAETFNISAAPQGTVTDVSGQAALTGALHATYKNLAADEYRSDIAKVPGSGSVRGVHYYMGKLYALRDNVAVDACVLHESTASGWSAISFGREIEFDGAVGEIFEGDTVTGVTSTASGTVKRALLRTGTWDSSGAGTLMFDSITGTFIDNEALQVSAATKVTSASVDSAIALLPGGKFEFDNISFNGTEYMYCADGVNELGEFDGTRWVTIRTGITGAKPRFVTGHRNHLFTAVGSSLQHSGIGQPYSWTALTGAAELSLGTECQGILPQTGDPNSGALVATTKERIFILYGTDSDNWNLVVHSPDSGGRAYTLQNIGFAHFLDTKGVTQLVASQAFGGFQLNVLTQAVQQFIDSKRGLETASCIVRNSNQYRLFFSDGSGLFCQVDPNSNAYKPSFGAIMPFDYEDRTMNTVESFVDDAGIERIFAGADDGYVYELDRGTSFDGDNISAAFLSVFNHSKSVRIRKGYKRTILQFKAGNTADLAVGYDLSYGNLDPGYGDQVSIGQNMNKAVQSAGGIWDTFNWDNFTWDSSYAQELNIDTIGRGESIALIVSSDTDENEPYTIHTAITHYTMGRESR